MLELQAAQLLVSQPAHHNQRRHESQDLKLFPELLGVPDLAILGLESSARSSLGIQLGLALSPGSFGYVNRFMQFFDTHGLSFLPAIAWLL
jgi:hypothetical protein